MIKILTIIGARPQIIKAAAISRAVAKRNDVEEIIVHTGQHYDQNMSEVFFDELGIPIPNASLEIEIDSYLLIKTDENGRLDERDTVFANGGNERVSTLNSQNVTEFCNPQKWWGYVPLPLSLSPNVSSPGHSRPLSLRVAGR